MSIHRLEPAKQFVTRMVLLNRFHAPDEDDYDSALHELGGVHRGFPSADIHDQAAYLVAAVMARTPFAEANFRTAFDYVANLLDHEGYDLEATLRDQQDLGNAVWDLKDEGQEAMEGFLSDWFKPRILKLA